MIEPRRWIEISIECGRSLCERSQVMAVSGRTAPPGCQTFRVPADATMTLPPRRQHLPTAEGTDTPDSVPIARLIRLIVHPD